ncbi:YigZ family protein [Lactobacillus sp. LC28-10]|uniref:YigZ family protein n=1 Tax=Secundilactobacillus angelensis TaxID=2722706 RepID=A0ABX1KYZ8_9LACO|nr:YigZ family protein [Secundilactobacillus angelensis]MCH5462209.1 YigZ family protein [Secundilactobacillus angelensis]NLR18500.1 YigZ family protein [Secundilactobacillus angelensis]
MSENYLTIKTSGSHELEIKKSRFISSVQRVSTKEEADAFIESVRQNNPKANHNCFAYMIGKHDEIQRESDDGEPSGTAGVPILEVLKRTKIHDVVTVVTRYFGGTKLGAGGLIRAYSNATSRVIEQVGLVAKVRQQDLSLTVSYSNYEKLSYHLEQQQINVLDTNYGSDVTVTIAVDLDAVEQVQADLMNLLSGQMTIAQGDEHYHEVDVPVYPDSED